MRADRFITGRPLLGGTLAFAALLACGAGCNSTSNPDMGTQANPDMAVGPDMSWHLTTVKPECEPDTLKISPLKGQQQLVISSLKIGDFNEGFDFTGDGKPDNKLSPLGSIANPEIQNSFTGSRDIILATELFGYTAGQDSACVKFPFYLGRVNEDKDGDGAFTSLEAGKADCDDTNPAVHPGATEDLTNGIDDDCDGFADNPKPGVKPVDDQRADEDGDGFTIAQGDCDDHDANRYPGAPELCNGKDDDCDGIADNGMSCDPFGDNDRPVHVQSLSFSNPPTPFPMDPITDASGLLPFIVFNNGSVSNNVLTAGPSEFQLSLPISGVGDLTLTLGGAQVQMTLAQKNNGTYVTEGILGGVLQATSLSQIHIDAGGVITKQQSLLDGIFVGPAGVILGLDVDKDGHYLPDVDFDGDGLETFWQANPGAPGPDGGAPLARIDRCKDGDGTIIEGTDCPMAKDDKGNYRFLDGLSATLKFTAVPAQLVDVTEK